MFVYRTSKKKRKGTKHGVIKGGLRKKEVSGGTENWALVLFVN